jgi:hypothetical protein
VEVMKIDNIFRIRSAVEYIRHYIAHIQLKDAESLIDFYFGFSLESQPLGQPKVKVKFIDKPAQGVKDAVDTIRDKILEMERDGALFKAEKKPFMEYDDR